MYTFAGRTALVTGGARGVGRAVATRLASAGAHVVVTCFHSYPAAKALQAELADMGLRLDVVRGSVARREQVERIFAEAASLVGGLDLLVNNAAAGRFGPVCAVADEAVERAISTNLMGSWWCAAAARELMRGRGGAIVNLSSVGAGLVVGNYAAVGTSKAAVESLTRYLAAEFAADGIRVNTASGGLLDGEVARLFPDADGMAAAVQGATPFGRLGHEGELADVVLFLLSDAARWVTGQTVVADGGLSLGAAMLTPAGQWANRNRRAGSSQVPAGPSGIEPTGNPAVVVPATGHDDAIAVVGAGVVVPGAHDLDGFWAVLRDGPDLFVDSMPHRWRAEAFLASQPDEEDKSYTSRSAYVTGPVADPTGPDDGTDPAVEFTARWLRRAVADAVAGVRMPAGERVECVFGYTPDGNQHLEESVVVDATLYDLKSLLREDGRGAQANGSALAQAQAALTRRYPHARADVSGLWPEVVGRRAVEGLLAGAPRMLMIDTACSSSLYALDIAVKALRERRADAVVCGGSFAVGPRNSVMFAKLHGLSARGEVRPLDRASDGVLFSDGAAVITAKRLADARRDGDPVLGYVVSVGTSSDGKGKAIYAPSVDGQRRAMARARERAPRAAQQLSWVVAHATGTPAGDLCELNALGTEAGPGQELVVSSNKSVIGHTGWAAGAASVIQALLAFRHGMIPAQHRFEQLPERLPLAAAVLRVPTHPVPWPGGERPRVVAISGFGFGGTNAHVLVADRPDLLPPEPPLPEPPPRALGMSAAGEASLAVVAWAADFPGLAGRSAVAAWLDGEGPAPEPSYGAAYPLRTRLRIPPPTQRVLDRCQLMAVSCADELRSGLGDVWSRHRDTTGVLLGHMGPTRTAVAYARRCYLDDVIAGLPGAVLGDLGADGAVAQRLRARVRDGVPPATEDSFPGMMPNIIAARIANYFDLHGPNMVVDTGFTSTISAFELARRYLLAGDVDLALVGGVNGNSTAEMRRLLRGLDAADREVREGAVLFAVTTAARARAWGLPVLATLTEDDLAPGGGTNPAAEPTYLGADGAVELLRRIRANSRPQARDAAGDGSAQPTWLPVEARAVRRHVARWRASPVSSRTTEPIFAADNVVVTGTPELLGGLGERAEDPLVLSSAPCPPAVRRRHVTELTPAAVRRVLSEAAPQSAGAPAHLRVVTDLQALHPRRAPAGADWSAVADLHDLCFVVLQALHTSLGRAGSSVLALFVRGDDGMSLHPFAGLFTGLLKSAALELPGCRVASAFTTDHALDAGVRCLAEEAAAEPGLPVAAYRHGIRHTLTVAEAAAVAGSGDPLGPDDVVVAVGGGSGILAEILRGVVCRYRPVVYVLGSTPLDEARQQLAALGGPAALTDRAAFLRRLRAADPSRPVRDANAEFERLHRTARMLDGLTALEQRCGPSRVHYRRADVRDRARVAAVVDEVFACHGRVDLLVHAAGINRSAALARKPLESFRDVRAVKVGGHRNLRAAFSGRPPRLWCNFGSFIGLTGQIGEADYAAANDFLATAAAASTDGGAEFTIGWTLWDEVGMGAHPVTRAFLAKTGTLTRMPTREGLAHFADELAAGERAAVTFHLGAAERAAIEAKVPALLADNSAEGGAGFYLDRVTERSRDRLVGERQFDRLRDAYLDDHAVAGVGTLPGLFVPEIAAEAALALRPGLVAAGFRDVVFERFLKLTPAVTRRPHRITATVTASAAGAASVLVEISGDLTAADGRLLQGDVPFFAATVVLADAYPPAPRWPGLGGGAEVAVPDPYHAPGSPVHLRGPFVTTHDLRVHPLGKRARYSCPVGRDHPVFGRFVVPSLLLDGLARVGVAELVAGRYIPVAAPRSIRRIDLFEPGGDADVTARHGQLELSVTPVRLRLEDARGRSRFVASAGDSRIVAQMHDVHGIVLGYVDAVTGAAVPPAAVDHVAGQMQPEWSPGVSAVAL